MPIQEVEETGEYGTSGADRLTEGYTDSVVGGFGGNDLLIAGAMNGFTDTFDGGSGIDTMSYASQGHRVVVDLNFGWGWQVSNTGTLLEQQVLVEIENVIGGDLRDSIVGNFLNNHLAGGGGNDSIDGGDGNDTVDAGSGHDDVEGGEGRDLLRGFTGNDTIHGEGGQDTLDGSTGNDFLDGGGSGDSLSGGSGNDRLEGELGNDTLSGGTEADTLDGGAGTDLARYDTGLAVTVNLANGTASGGHGNDVLVAIENVTTGGGSDSLTGNTLRNVLNSGNGHDTVTAGSGNDQVDAGAHNDVVSGEGGHDSLYGGTGNDQVFGGNDRDTIDGGSGNDTLSGGFHNDVISGGTGGNLLRGGQGADTVSGGSDADVFRWQAGDTGQDLMLSFDLAEDRLSFGEGFFAAEPVGATELGDVLYAFPDFAGGSFLMANTALLGWVSIARVANASTEALNAMIDNESILAVSVAPVGDAAGGFGVLG
jgi:Ca2+-binding RTX toxin-like protein